MPISRLSLTSVKTSIDTAISNLVNTVQYNALLDELRRGTTPAATANAFSYLGLTVASTLTQVYNTITSNAASNTEAYEKSINSAVIGQNVTNANATLDYTDFPTGLTNIQVIASAVEDIDDILDLTNVDTRFDTLAEIVTQIISENASFETWIAKKYEKANLVTGSSTFNLTDNTIGLTHIEVPFTDFPDNYSGVYIKIMPSAACGGNLGEIRVDHSIVTGANKKVTFDVYISGTTTANFDYLLMFYF